MPKKPRTAAQLANDQRLRDSAKARKEAKPTLNPGLGEDPVQTISNPEVDELKRQIEELKLLFAQQAQPQFQPQYQMPQFNQAGNIVGTREKYSSDATRYPSPVERLRKEQRLQRFAFNDNYDLDYSIEKIRYQTVDGHWQSEPRFKLELSRIMYDEDTGEPTDKRYVVCRLWMHEDPEAALAVAEQYGLNVENNDEKMFLDELRYLRFRDWLIECFYPGKPTNTASKFADEVIGGKLVQVYTKTSENAEGIPFTQFDKARKL